MKMSREEYNTVCKLIKGEVDAGIRREVESQELRDAIGEHDPTLAIMLRDAARKQAEVGLYLTKRLELEEAGHPSRLH